MWATLDTAWLRRAMGRRRLTWLGPLLLTPVLAGLGWFGLPTTWKSQAKVFVQDSKAVNPFLEDMRVDFSAQSRIQVLSTVLKSQSTLQQVLEEIGELTAKDSPDRVDARVRAFRNETDVFSLGGGVVQISVTAGTPESAEKNLRVLMDTFIAEMLRPQKQSVEGATRFLKTQLERLRGELVTLEAETATFKSNNAGELPEVYRVNLDALLQLRKALMDAEMTLEANKRQRRLAEERLRKLNPVTQELEARLIDARTRLAEARSLYTDEHLDVMTAMTKVRELERQLRAPSRQNTQLDLGALEAFASRASPDSDNAGRATGKGGGTDLLASEVLAFKQLLSDIEGQEGKVDLLRGKLEEASKSVQAFARNEQSLNRILRDLDIKTRVYRTLLEKYEEALVTRELSLYDEDNQVWIIEPPNRPTRPMKPPMVVVVLGGVAGGGLIGFILVLVAEFLAAGVRRHEVEALAGARIIASVPELRP